MAQRQLGSRSGLAAPAPASEADPGVLAAAGMVAGEGVAGVLVAGLVAGGIVGKAAPVVVGGMAGELSSLAILAGLLFFLIASGRSSTRTAVGSRA